MSHLPSTMSAVVLTGHGGPEKLEYKTDVPVPTPGKNEVLIKVEAAGVNNTDINTRVGWYSKGGDDDASWGGNPFVFPRIQGADVCGVIVGLGEGVSQDRLGQRVMIEPCLHEAKGEPLDQPWYFGSECDGGFAQYCVVSSKYAYGVKTDLTSIELASFPCSYSTAENMLTRSNVGAGDRVLVTGASGGVGSAAIQLAKARGAHVIALTSLSKAEGLLEIGADQTLDRSLGLLDQIERNSIDVVIDLVAGPSWPDLLEVLRPKGRYAVSGAIGGAMVELDVRTLYLKDLSFFGCTVIEPEVFGNLCSLIEAGKIKPLVGKTYPLNEINEAQVAFQEKQYIGKIVLTV
ncbi:Zinc-binding dehydrogenase family protein [Candidatus Terasakiella magnetica]|uniref:Zinc-binding dehydrogenase family protein n=1 Tax=Candidatus Terasakiella magnetica TaxID=1867952 RepID=A0A1C3RFD8_9PROT|nr:alcohol dehydrogenase family protein [Candidatus Terasakiella magnetica]SCA55978.1 Zinc-binding dehydrogenase family protein [Candidatus Terasakiella magnetica]